MNVDNLKRIISVLEEALNKIGELDGSFTYEERVKAKGYLESGVGKGNEGLFDLEKALSLLGEGEEG